MGRSFVSQQLVKSRRPQAEMAATLFLLEYFYESKSLRLSVRPRRPDAIRSPDANSVHAVSVSDLRPELCNLFKSSNTERSPIKTLVHRLEAVTRQLTVGDLVLRRGRQLVHIDGKVRWARRWS